MTFSTPASRSCLLSLFVLSGSVILPAQGQDDVVYPANAPDASYAELDKLPDFRGLWFPAFAFGSGPAEEPKLIGAAKEFYETETAKVAADPNYEIPEGPNNCEPPGMPYFMTMPYSIEFLFTPGKITVMQEAHMMVRRIFTDGRPFPEEPDPGYFGDSRGHWEGDTLVVETRNTRAGQRLGVAGIYNSEDLVIHERLYLDKDNPDTLHLDFTYEDPNVLEQPWHLSHTFRRDRTWEMLEYICDENDRHPVDANGQTQADF
ncbi:MAG TPA: hypothetical protein VNR18_06980 [Hyphomicrobiales bacterium]|nr:hypothetical protein [Hyphomicrobiales bacterium]